MSSTLDVQSYVDTQAPPASHDLNPIASVPWVSIALAVHVLFLVVAWFIVPLAPVTSAIEIITASSESVPLPPTPEMPTLEDSKWPDPDQETVNPQPETNLVEDRTDPRNESDTDIPNESLAVGEDSNIDSPHPATGKSSAVGLGGGASGGNGGGGRGGMRDLRIGVGKPGGRRQPERVDAALLWLKDHQNIEGYWSSTGFSEDTQRKNAKKTFNLEFVAPGDPKGDKGWDASVDVGLTGLALLAFAGAGNDHKTGAFTEPCRRGLSYLRKVQYDNGCFGPADDDQFVYNHAICTMAVVEMYGLSGDLMLKGMAERAVQFIVRAQNPNSGWRYGVRTGESDTSVTGWMVLALKSAKMTDLQFDASKCFGEAANWLNAATVEVNGYSKTGYDLPGSDNARLRGAQMYLNNPSMDAINIMSRLFMNDGKWTVSHPVVRQQATECARNVPSWEHEKIDYYYWYYASLALFQVDGPSWKAWETPMVKTLLANQRGWRPEDKGTTRDTLDEHGSWDAVDAWGSAGGRIYATAINCLTLQTWTRYEKIHAKKDVKSEK